MRFLLDTNICIYIIKQKPQKVFEKFQTLEIFDIGISSVTIAELEYGVYKSQRVEQNRAALTQFLITLPIVAFDERSTQTYGQIRAGLERQGIVVGAMDLLIARTYALTKWLNCGYLSTEAIAIPKINNSK